jgi:Sap, sulfolipid-1-addressing protein
MFWNVLLLGGASGLDPGLIGAVAFMLSRTKPKRLPVAYFVGGLGVSLIAGFVILFVLKNVGAGKRSSFPPEIEIAVGALGLLVAALVGSGLAARLRERWQSRRAMAHATEHRPGTNEQPGTDQLHGVEKLPPRVQRALASETPWVAWVAGVAYGMPGAYYLAAIAVILKSGVAAPSQIGALLVFNLVAFAAVVIPLVGYVVAPEATQTRVQQFYAWVGAHRRSVLATLAGGVGAYLLVIGISKLG